MKTNIFRKIGIAFLSLLILMNCKKDDNDVLNPQDPDENEVITTVVLTLADTGNENNRTTVYFRSMDAGKSATLPDTLTIASRKVYAATLWFLNESVTPADTISNEVKEKAEEHQVFFTFAAADVSLEYQDKDKNNVPLGLQTTWITGAQTSDKRNGSVKIVLKHQGESKPATGKGDPSAGSTDVEVTFPLLIK